MTTLFISDLHLDAARPATTALFLEFLEDRVPRAEALYILGDLFEAWIGDDDDAELAAELAAALKAASRHTRLHFVHGNRDFLLGERYAATAGLRLLPEYSVIGLYGTPTLLLHGDQLCTDDTAYQAFRTQIRAPARVAQLLALPLAQRRALAAQLREDSRGAMRNKVAAIMDVNQDAVRAALRAHGVTQMIHGHTHRPAIHALELDGETARRIVLGDWYAQGSVLVVEPDGLQLEGLHGR